MSSLSSTHYNTILSLNKHDFIICSFLRFLCSSQRVIMLITRERSRWRNTGQSFFMLMHEKGQGNVNKKSYRTGAHHDIYEMRKTQKRPPN